jgi:hypothetical protein
METKIDVRKVLRVFNKVQDLGTAVEDGYQYKGLTASQDFDGYTIILKDDYVSVTVFFHNKFSLDYTRSATLHGFLEKLDQVDRVKRTN